MLFGHPLKRYLKYSLFAAIAYSVVAWFYIKEGSFNGAWILYAGNFVFAIAIAAFIFIYKRKYKATPVGTMITASHITAVMGILMSCVICLLMLMVFEPAIFHFTAGTSDPLQRSPAQFGGRNKGYAIILFMDAIVGNISTASFIGILLPFALAKRIEDTGNRTTTDETNAGGIKKNIGKRKTFTRDLHNKLN